MKKLTIDTLIYGLGPQVPKLASFLILPFITPYLTKTDYGIFGLLTAYTAALSAFQFLGLRLNIVNAFYHYGSRYIWVWRQLYGFLKLWNIVYAGLIVILLYFVIPEEAIHHKWEIIF